jgi:hypothetical protein
VVVTDDPNTSSLSPTKNFVGSIALIVCSGSNTYIKFSLANLGSAVTGSNVSKATLILYTDFVLTPGTTDLYQVGGSWSEGKITWNNAPALGTQLFSAVSVTSPGYLSLDVTSTVQGWLNGTLANNGIALVPSSGSKLSVSFDSKENILTSNTAQLPLVLVSAGPQGPQGPQGATGAPGLPGAIGPQGPAGINNRGNWLSGNAYNPSDAVSYGNSFWMATAADNGSQAPSANPNWQLLAAGINNRGVWNAGNSYSINDAVTDGGSYWLAMVATSASNATPNTSCQPAFPPSPCAADWQLLAAAGAQGSQGQTGAQGPPGIHGVMGLPGLPGPPSHAYKCSVGETSYLGMRRLDMFIRTE